TSGVFQMFSGIVTISGLKITGGRASVGAGVLITNPGAGSIENLIGVDIESNTATLFGGGLRARYGTLNLINSTVANNFSANYGAGLEFLDTHVTITNSTDRKS